MSLVSFCLKFRNGRGCILERAIEEEGLEAGVNLVGSGYDGTCMVCSGGMKYYFSKAFNNWGLTTVDYEKCVDCGFTVCASLLRMTQSEWVDLNQTFHSSLYKGSGDRFGREGRLDGQARVIDIFLKHGVISEHKSMLDWGSGVGGDLASRMMARGRFMYSYDRYMTPLVNRIEAPEKRSFSLVTAGAVFEHLKSRSEVDAIESLVMPEGVLGVHLLIPPQILPDPDWVYLLPVHCAFHTWESMRRLMVQWEYEASVYCHEALMWFFFKSKNGLKEKVDEINSESGGSYLWYSDGFVSATGIELPLDSTYGVLDKKGKYLYVGLSGGKVQAGWVSKVIDFSSADAALASLNSLKSFDGAESFDYIYSDSVAERMMPSQFDDYLALCRSLLKQGGIHRIVTFDNERALDSIRTGAWKEFPWVRKAGLSTPAEYLNAIFRSWGHVYIYDEGALKKRLDGCGYKNVRKASRLRGRAASLYFLDRETHRIYFDAER